MSTTTRTNTAARPRAFTLVEVLVATIIVGLIATSVAVVISRTFKTRRAAEARTEASSRAKAAAAMIARDVQNAFRDGDLLQTRVQIIASADKRDQLLLLARTDRAVRSAEEQNESEVHEVQYRVSNDLPDAGAPGAVGTSLWKREDPLPDEYLDAGGVAAPVVPGVTELTVEAYDGETWTNDWDSDTLGFPMAIRVNVKVMASSDDAATPRGVTVAARQVIAFDRTPLPGPLAAAPAPAQIPTGDTGTGTGTDTGTGTGAGTGGGGGGGGGGFGGGGGRGGGGGGRGNGGGGGRGNGGGGGPGGGGGNGPVPIGPGGGGGGRPGGGGGAPGGGGGGPVLIPGGGGGGPR